MHHMSPINKLAELTAPTNTSISSQASSDSSSGYDYNSDLVSPETVSLAVNNIRHDNA